MWEVVLAALQRVEQPLFHRVLFNRLADRTIFMILHCSTCVAMLEWLNYMQMTCSPRI